MKREVLEKAMAKLPDEYILEALENRNVSAKVTSIKGRGMTKRLILIAIVASFIVSIGIAVAAVKTDFFGFKVRDVEPDETLIVSNFYYDEEGRKINADETDTIDNASKVITMETQEECKEVEFKTNYIPSDYQAIGGEYGAEFGDPDSWNTYLQIIDSKGYPINISVVYASNLGEDGYVFMTDQVFKEEESVIGEYTVVKYWAMYNDAYGNESHYTYMLMMYHPSGYILFLLGDRNMEELEKIAENIEVRETGRIVTYNSNDSHEVCLGNGVG